jgi:hypothetical protein
MATSRKPQPKDPGLRDQDQIASAEETIERAVNSGFGKVKYDEVFSAVMVPPGSTTTPNSRAPGVNLAPGVRVPSERNAAAYRITGKCGQAEEFPTVGGASTTALVRNLLSTAHYQAAVNARPGTEPGDPVVVVSPQQDDAGEIPPAWRPVIGYSTSNVRADGHAPQITVHEV